MDANDQFSEDVIANLPNLRAFAHRLARDHALAEDMVQDTVVRALTHRQQFQPGTNLGGWLAIILRNRYLNQMRRRGHRAEIQMDFEFASGGNSGGQEEMLEFRDFKLAFVKLPATQQQALDLVGANGLSYEEAAQITGCAVGTMKSRVSRARVQLKLMLNGDDRKDNRLATARRTQPIRRIRH
jgi:RNA polymerase sigma-70 factor (ECF subfamily)